MIEQLIETLVKEPNEENISNYFEFINEMEITLLENAEAFPFKSQEYFNMRTKAFAYRRECAMITISKWVSTYGSSKNCPVTYADTLNIPFKTIKKST